MFVYAHAHPHADVCTCACAGVDCVYMSRFACVHEYKYVFVSYIRLFKVHRAVKHTSTPPSPGPSGGWPRRERSKTMWDFI